MAALLNPGQMGRQRRMRLFFSILWRYTPFPSPPFSPPFGYLETRGWKRLGQRRRLHTWKRSVDYWDFFKVDLSTKMRVCAMIKGKERPCFTTDGGICRKMAVCCGAKKQKEVVLGEWDFQLLNKTASKLQECASSKCWLVEPTQK